MIDILVHILRRGKHEDVSWTRGRMSVPRLVCLVYLVCLVLFV
jgi:hypothetical protein